jgi:parvulin-like peptidyl-prolyl isomerase
MDMLKTRPQILDKLKEYSEQEFTRETRKMREGAHIPSEEEFRTALEQQGLTYENLKRSITRGFMTNEYMRNRIFNALDPLGLPQIRQYYEEHPGEFMLQDRVRWQDIFIDAFSFKSRAEAHAHAEAIARRAMAGEDFAALVQEFDQGTSKGMPNGEGIGQERGQIRPPELEPYLFQLKSGEVGPILEMPFGYHVFRVVHREYAGRQPFDAKTQEEITKKIKDLIAKREYKRIVDDLRRKATIQKFLDN